MKYEPRRKLPEVSLRALDKLSPAPAFFCDGGGVGGCDGAGGISSGSAMASDS